MKLEEFNLSVKIQPADFTDTDWILHDGGWLVLARNGDRWVHIWPTGQRPEGVFKSRQKAAELVDAVKRAGYVVKLIRIGPDEDLKE